jgi:hypothetical protein
MQLPALGRAKIFQAASQTCEGAGRGRRQRLRAKGGNNGTRLAASGAQTDKPAAAACTGIARAEGAAAREHETTPARGREGSDSANIEPASASLSV